MNGYPRVLHAVSTGSDSTSSSPHRYAHFPYPYIVDSDYQKPSNGFEVSGGTANSYNRGSSLQYALINMGTGTNAYCKGVYKDASISNLDYSGVYGFLAYPPRSSYRYLSINPSAVNLDSQEMSRLSTIFRNPYANAGQIVNSYPSFSNPLNSYTRVDLNDKSSYSKISLTVYYGIYYKNYLKIGDPDSVSLHYKFENSSSPSSDTSTPMNRASIMSKDFGEYTFKLYRLYLPSAISKPNSTDKFFYYPPYLTWNLTDSSTSSSDKADIIFTQYSAILIAW